MKGRWMGQVKLILLLSKMSHFGKIKIGPPLCPPKCVPLFLETSHNMSTNVHHLGSHLSVHSCHHLAVTMLTVT